MRVPPVVWLILTGLGIALPYAAFLPWLAANGPDWMLFLEQAFANPIASFSSLDVIVSAVVLLLASWTSLPAQQALWVTAATLGVGVSAGLPLLLYYLQRRVN